MYNEFKDRADFWVVYLAEAHTIDEWQSDSNEAEGIRLKQHESFEERKAAARLCREKLGLSIPTLVDGMNNDAFEAFSAWPERIYIVNGLGRVHYRGGPGPFDFKPDSARSALLELLESS